MSSLLSLVNIRQILLRISKSQSVLTNEGLNYNLVLTRNNSNAAKLDSKERQHWQQNLLTLSGRVIKDDCYADRLFRIKFERDRHEKVGISEFLGPPPKITGIIKDRFEEFIVNEVDEDGNILSVTDASPPIEHVDRKNNEYIHFNFQKVGMTTDQIVNILQRRLRCPEWHVTYAGKKDKWAVTTQRISVKNVNGVMDSLIDMNRKEKSRLRVGNFTYTSYPLRLGDLIGNQFKILVKDVLPYLEDSQQQEQELEPVSTQVINEAMQGMSERGTINYFGLQRFGTQAHLIGMSVLQEKWEEVFDLILAARPVELNLAKEVKTIWATERDPAKMVSLIPKARLYSSDEVMRLTLGLSRHYPGSSQEDLVKAYKTIPKNMCRMHLSAFQSYLWNKVASYRIKHYGMTVLPGDCVYTDPPSDNNNNNNSSSLLKKAKMKDVYIGAEGNIRIGREMKKVTGDDIKSKKYSIYNVVMPTLGPNILHYKNPQLQNICNKVLAEHGLPPNCFEKFKNPLMHNGIYRPLILRAENVKWEIVRYAQSHPPRIHNNMDNEKIHPPPNDLVKDKIAVILQYTLPAGCYATTVLREAVHGCVPLANGESGESG